VTLVGYDVDGRDDGDGDGDGVGDGDRAAGVDVVGAATPTDEAQLANLADILADGMPFGVVGQGIDGELLDASNRACVFEAMIGTPKFVPRTRELVHTFMVRPEHKYVAMPLGDVQGRVVVAVHIIGRKSRTREGYGKKVGVTATARARVGQRKVALRRMRRHLNSFLVEGDDT